MGRSLPGCGCDTPGRLTTCRVPTTQLFTLQLREISLFPHSLLHSFIPGRTFISLQAAYRLMVDLTDASMPPGPATIAFIVWHTLYSCILACGSHQARTRYLDFSRLLLRLDSCWGVRPDARLTQDITTWFCFHTGKKNIYKELQLSCVLTGAEVRRSVDYLLITLINYVPSWNHQKGNKTTNHLEAANEEESVCGATSETCLKTTDTESINFWVELCTGRVEN